MGAGMRLIIAVIALIVLGSIVSAIAVLVGGSSVKIGQGELRCEGVGTVIINIAGEDYAVEPIAGWQYPPYSAFGTTPPIQKMG
jgi:hypothetical protein